MTGIKKAMALIIVAVIALAGVTLFSDNESPSNVGDHEAAASRYDKVPSDAVKMSPEMDSHPPVLHSFLWEDPVILKGGVNTAGLEDSPFISPDGAHLYFFFTPIPRVPAEEQLYDGVTGIWVSEKVNDEWAEATRLLLNAGVSLDGCPYVNSEEIWFCSAREGNYKDLDFWVGTLTEGGVVDVRNAGEELNSFVRVGELHFSPDGNTVYYHADSPGGLGGMDVWAVDRDGGGWGEPYNVEAVNSPESEGYPYISENGDEMWINRWHRGTPATFRSKKIGGQWTVPELIISSFAGEPNLDSCGNIYFVHHYYEDGEMVEADIYVAYRKPSFTPPDIIEVPERGYLLGVLPTPYEGQSFEEAYEAAGMTCDLVPVWGKPSPFWEKASDLEGKWGETFVQDLTRGNGMAPVLHLSFIGEELKLSSPPGVTGSLSDENWRLLYKRAVVESVEAVKPVYLSIGNEVNRWYEKYGWEGENGFRHWLSLYEEIYDEVKELSPETVVFCTFSRENVSENKEADLSVIDYFDPHKLDLLILTSYPHSVSGINKPSDIPLDYYRRVSERLPGKPIGFSEITWPSHSQLGGEEAQVEFMTLLDGELIDGIDVEFVTWAWLTDLTAEDATGLIRRDGKEKLAYEVWNCLSK